MKHRPVHWLIVAVLALGAASSYFFLSHTAADIPHAIGGLQLQTQISGDEAATIINRMHGKGVTTDENTIGIYASDEGEATLYLSVYGSPKQAEAALDKMKSLLSMGSPPFTGFRAVQLEGRPAFFCFGVGQAHYFFAHNDGVYWLAADQPIASRTASILRSHLITRQ